MYNTSKLRGRIVEKFGSQKAFVDAGYATPSCLSQYLNGKMSLNQQTIDKWIEALDIPADEIHLYFFTH